MTRIHKKKRYRENTGKGGRAGLILACLFMVVCLSACSASPDDGANHDSTERTAAADSLAQADADARGAEEGVGAENGFPAQSAGEEQQEEAPDAVCLSVKEQLTVGDEPRDGWVIAFETLNVRRFCYAQATVVGSFAAGQQITVTGPEV